jgi:alpha-glucosidase
MYLPRGDWFYYYTDEPKTGGAEVWAAAGLDRIPLFVRAGAVVPFYPVQQYVGEQVIEEVTLHVYYKAGQESSVLYDDGGEGYGYQNGEHTTRRFTVTGTDKGLLLQQAIEGDYQPSFTRYRVVLHGLPFSAVAYSTDGQPVEVVEATLETGLTLPAIVVASDFTELVAG